MEDKSYIIYVDTGGTFTDAVVVEPAGTFIIGKAPTTTERLEVGFLNAISNAAEKMGKELNEVLANCSQIGYGTTEGAPIWWFPEPGALNWGSSLPGGWKTVWTRGGSGRQDCPNNRRCTKIH